MELFRIIKKDAKAAMRFCGGRTLACIFTVLLAYLVINLTESLLLFVFYGGGDLLDFYSLSATAPLALIITAICSLLYFSVIPALCLGSKKLLCAFANGEDESLSIMFDTFSSFKSFVGSAVFGIMQFLRHCLTFAFCLVPGSALIYVAVKYTPLGSATLDILKIAACCVGIGLLLLCSALGLIFVQRWSLAPYYRAKGEKIHRSFALSVKTTKGLCTNIIAFKFSFLGWGILSLLVLPLLWTLPYYLLSKAIYAKYLMERYERSLAEIPSILEDDESEE